MKYPRLHASRELVCSDRFLAADSSRGTALPFGPYARGEARLADFGLARVAKQRAGTDATVASFSAVCGTASFLDPI